MSEIKYFSLLLLILSLIVLAVSTQMFPSIVVNEISDKDIPICDLSNYWKSQKVELPLLTKYVLTFSKAVTARRLGYLIFFILSISVEIFVKNKKASGTFHYITLMLGILLSWYILFAIILPGMPI